MNVNRWVDDKLAALDDGRDWQPEASLARTRLRELDRKARMKRWWAWGTAAAACLGLLAFMQPRACAMPRGCSQAAPVADNTAPPPAQTAPQTANAATPNYKESGAATAQIACEIYSDYECPSCAAFFRDTLPLLVADYVQTGKVKLLHRDFPLVQHSYARLAARYANAAGEAGQYDPVVTRLFQTQDIWGHSGDIEAQLSPILPPAIMRKVHDKVQHDAHLDDTVVADHAMGISDNLRATPTMVVVWKGHRQLISPIPSYPLLRSYLDSLLTQQ